MRNLYIVKYAVRIKARGAHLFQDSELQTLQKLRFQINKQEFLGSGRFDRLANQLHTYTRAHIRMSTTMRCIQNRCSTRKREHLHFNLNANEVLYNSNARGAQCYCLLFCTR